MMNVDEGARVLVSRRCLICPAPVCMRLVVYDHVLDHVALAWQFDWPGALSIATSY